VREGLEFESPIVSDSASLWRLARATADAAPVACMRDLTRGGLSSALNELARLRGVAVEIDEAAVPVREQVAAACEILGFDPLYVACEGRFVAFVREADAPRALEAMRAHPDGREAARIGRVLKGGRAGDVTVRTPYGAARPLDMLSGEQLPRIC
jgi:hydrogenase expression/formation protein HypE